VESDLGKETLPPLTVLSEVLMNPSPFPLYPLPLRQGISGAKGQASCLIVQLLIVTMPSLGEQGISEEDTSIEPQKQGTM
jgi:hypothetical protein